MDIVTKGAQDAISPYLNDKEKLISIAKTLQESHYALLTNHADLTKSIGSLTDKIKQEREEATKLLDSYNENKNKLADLVDEAVGQKNINSKPASDCSVACSPQLIQTASGAVNQLASNIHEANDHINTLKNALQQKSVELNDVTATKTQNMVLSQMIQSALQTAATRASVSNPTK